MKYKRFFLLLVFLGYCFFLAPDETEAADAKKDTEQTIPLNAEYFPDENLRIYLKENADSDGNGVLSLEERLAVTEIKCSEYFFHAKLNEANPDYSSCVIKQLTGIEWFPELEDLELYFGFGYQNRIIFDGFQKLKKIDLSSDIYAADEPTELLSITDCPALEDVEVFGFYNNNLKCVRIERCNSLGKMHLLSLSIDQLVLIDLPNLTDQGRMIYPRMPKLMDIRFCDSENIVERYNIDWADYPDYQPIIITPDITENGWIKIKDLYYYLIKSGGVKTGWVKWNDNWYFCDDMTEFERDEWLKRNIGARQTGWQEIKGKKYYFGTDGVMRTGWKEIGGKRYYFGTDGVMRTGWKEINGKRFYFGTDGVRRVGWKDINGKRFYFGTDGVMRTGWKQIKERYFYFGTNGVMRTGWQKISDRWFYFGTDGVRRNNWQKIDNKWYYFGTNGVMRTGWQKIDNKWYFFTNGVMKTGWKQYKGEWYYFGGDGSMVTGARTVGGKAYQFSADGVCLNP